MPTVTVEVDQGDLHRLEHKLDTIGRRELEQVVDRSAAYAQAQASAGINNQTGATARSLVAEVRGLEMRVHSPLARALPEEFGRRAGAKMPPASAFASRGPAAFLIARAIAKRGVKGRFFMRRARQLLAERELPRLVAWAAKQIEAAWGRA